MLFLRFSKKCLSEDANCTRGAGTTDIDCCGRVFDKVMLRERQSMLAKYQSERFKAGNVKAGKMEKRAEDGKFVV